MAFPTSFDALRTDHPGGSTDVMSKDEQNKLNGAVNKLEEKVGLGNSPPAAGKVLIGQSGTTSTWTDPTHAALTDVDTNASPSAIHHTLGTGANQAASGAHAHAHSDLTGVDTDGGGTAIHHTLGAL